jgi:mannose-6-phosphate isomerase-like protein (cupin superfamily)
MGIADARLSKDAIVEMYRKELTSQGFEIAEIDATRPWGAFLRVLNEQADRFIQAYFGEVEVPDSVRHGERSPKILLVAPHKRLSWQYHERRAEYWRVIRGAVGVFVSATNAPPNRPLLLDTGETIELERGMRHRLVGMEEWGAVAEIWIHVDPQNPSNEADIFRLQDDYHREETGKTRIS